ncbi:4-amino-4-deoxy-L-arabinose transferase [Hymenobacter psychrophilus]|uniref:4-amino-4-deoxy-L-arabinose transferase n=2 Tax=Hymenobacter psychrophilus TaxID=651662 RepID=A0A1H3NCP9_9BACT|nr:4-amino-4-deoxy-L-arabinose transferase [Hymenobacter psychrophilus]
MSYQAAPRRDNSTLMARLFTSRWGRVLLLGLICGVSFFLHNGASEVSLMESRNFVAAREMVAGGSWLIPTMNHELRLAKPPLPTWAVAGLQRLIGPTQNLALLRVPAGLAATLLVFFFWGLARALTRGQPAEATAPGRTAWLAALVLATSLLVVTTGREGQWDIFATSLAIGGLWLLVEGWQRPVRQAYLWLAGAGVLLGMAMLSKGPVPIYALVLPFLLAYFIGRPTHRQALRARTAGTVLAAGLAVVIGGSWPLYIWLKVAPAARAVARVEIASWGERHVQPVWYYWPFFAFTGLWALVALAALVWPYARPRLRGYLPYGVALGWLLAGLLLLSIVPEKKERYMLPLMPPLALLVAGLLRYWQSQELGGGLPARTGWLPDSWLPRTWGALLVLLLLALPVAMVLTGFTGFGLGSVRFGLVVALVVALGVGLVRQGILRRQVNFLIGSTLVVVVSIIALVMPAYPRWEGRRDVPGQRQLRQLPGLRGVGEWYSLDTLHVKQVWAAGQAVPIWHPTVDQLAGLAHPVVTVSGQPAEESLPAGWADVVRITRQDSFYLDRGRNSAVWFVSRLEPIIQIKK